MKKSLVVVTLILVVFNSFSQSFYKGALVPEFRTGIEVYNIYGNITQTTSTRTFDTTYTNKAANAYWGLGAEYGLHKYFGAGLSFNSHKYFTEKDSTSGNKSLTKANNILVMLNLHPVTTKKLDLVMGTDIGYSMFFIHNNDKDNTKLDGKGFYFSAYLNPRIYFGNFGIQFKLSTPFAKYNNLSTNNENFNKNNKYNYLKLSAAWGIGFGIQYRIFKDKSAVPSKVAEESK